MALPKEVIDELSRQYTGEIPITASYGAFLAQSYYEPLLSEKDKEIERLTGKWVSVEEGMPEEDVMVLIYDSNYHPEDDRVGCTVGFYEYTMSLGWLCHDDRLTPTHWMPLPAPPNKDIKP